MKRFAFIAVILLTVGYGFSAASQVEFVAKVKSIDVESEQVANLTMQLTSTFDMKVRVTGMTEIRGAGDAELAVKDLDTDMLLKIEGIFTGDTILAKEIQVFEGVSAFEVKGKIDSVDATAKTITVLSLVIKVTDETEIKGAEGDLAFGDLKPGDIVRVAGEIEDGLIATDILVSKAKEFKAPRISFEGIVTAVKTDELTVLVEGVDEVVVHLSDKTDVQGEVAVGVGVRVIGTIGEGLVVDAQKVIVQKLLQVAPTQLKLQVDQAREVAVILHTFFEEDVEVKLASAKPEIAEPSATTLVIPAGKLTAKFEVKGKAVGETVIEVSLPASFGGAKAEVAVGVEAKGGGKGDDGDGGDDKEDPALRWNLPSLTLAVDQSRKLTLHLATAAEGALKVALSVKTGPTDVVTFSTPVDIPAGGKSAIVNFVGAKPGTVTVLAKLPAEAGGAEATIEIEVVQKAKGK
ncbi:MAG: hypothetical protein EHM61_15665 [Acidobacteria bacterium]|nr:MAG: hypothetical protein EHM61_15665 [Acidobacteriota bacterium]